MLNEMFSSLFTLKDKSSHRVSSWDQRGKNRDYILIKPKSTYTLADIDGPGVIRHIYFTTIMQRPLDFRRAVLKMYWDDENEPSVEVPWGDFFGISNCVVRPFNSLMITVNRGVLSSYGMNSYFPMPFNKHARIEIENQGRRMLGGVTRALWFHIDYEKMNKPFPENIGYFHSQYRQETPTKLNQEIKNYKNTTLWRGKNLDGKDNYVILEAEGDGQLAGLILGVDNIAGGWYGEGDDMIFVDDDVWPPSFHGTGSEEIFGGGASPAKEYTGPYTGFHLVENFDYSGKNAMYRWYIHDPIRFKKKIRWTIEHGHANNFENDYSSVAFWYQKEPHIKFPPLPPVKERIPRRPELAKKLLLKQVLLFAKYQIANKEIPDDIRPQVEVLFIDFCSSYMEGHFQKAMEQMKELNTILKKKKID